jgi:hypothetical protein
MGTQNNTTDVLQTSPATGRRAGAGWAANTERASQNVASNIAPLAPQIAGSAGTVRFGTARPLDLTVRSPVLADGSLRDEMYTW